MADPYTLKKLTDVDDSAPEFGFGEIQQSRFAMGDLQARRPAWRTTGSIPASASRSRTATTRPKRSTSSSGSGRVKLDDEIVALEARDALRVAPGVTRCFEAGADGLEFIVFGSHHKGDGEIIQGWWS